MVSPSSMPIIAGVEFGLTRVPSNTNRTWFGSTAFLLQKALRIFSNRVVGFTLNTTWSGGGERAVMGGGARWWWPARAAQPQALQRHPVAHPLCT